MKLKYFLAPMLAVISCGALHAQNADTTPSPNPEHDHYGHGRRHHEWIWKKLDLTDAQKTQIKSIREAMKGQTRPAMVAVLKAKLQLQQDITQNSQTQITADASALANAEAQFATIRATELTQVKAVLNNQQQTTLAEFQQKRQARMQDRISKLSQPSS
jgi:Spy/CpxP family protein refolding chaperone